MLYFHYFYLQILDFTILIENIMFFQVVLGLWFASYNGVLYFCLNMKFARLLSHVYISNHLNLII